MFSNKCIGRHLLTKFAIPVYGPLCLWRCFKLFLFQSHLVLVRLTGSLPGLFLHLSESTQQLFVQTRFENKLVKDKSFSSEFSIFEARVGKDRVTLDQYKTCNRAFPFVVTVVTVQEICDFKCQVCVKSFGLLCGLGTGNRQNRRGKSEKF